MQKPKTFICGKWEIGVLIIAEIILAACMTLSKSSALNGMCIPTTRWKIKIKAGTILEIGHVN